MHWTMGGSTAGPRRIAGAWLAAALLALLLAGCGGSGSSGFDAVAAENDAIDQALDNTSCVTEGGLTICASGEVETPPTPPTAEPSFTATPQAVGSATPTGTQLAERTPTPTGTPFFATPTTTRAPGTPTASPTRTATLAPAQPSVDIQPDPTDIANCASTADSQSCTLRIVFVPVSAPAGAAYRAAVRQRNPDSNWRVMPVEGNVVEISIPPEVSVVQTAILLFEREPGPVPNQVEVLADTGADFAFVTAPLDVRAGP